jgi:hypothetical protein
MRKSPRLLATSAIVVLAACGDGAVAPSADVIAPSLALVAPVFVAGNPSCTALGYPAGLKIDPPDAGTYSSGDGLLTVTITRDGETYDWSASAGSVLAAIAKGGPNANFYAYDPPATADDGLVSPINPSNGQPFGLSHIELCYDPDLIILGNLVVSKDATTHKARIWEWTIEKSADQTDLVLSAGQLFGVDYTVAVDATAIETNTLIDGEITIFNNNPTQSVTIEDVIDVVAPGFEALVACPVSFSYDLAAQATLVCSYEADAWGEQTAGTNIVTVTATSHGLTDDIEADAPWDFASAELDDEDDECIDLADTNGDVVPTQVCADEVPASFDYTLWFGAHPDAGVVLECGENTHDNVASFATQDTGALGSDTWTVNATVACDVGCTLTPGYWKTHSEKGPAPYDDTWAELASGADTPFFTSGQSYHDVLWTAPKGNAYYILAHAWIAAELNQLNGASIPADVLASFDAATGLLASYTPAQVAAFKGNNAVRKQLIELAGTLDAYNNGLTGPGHCSDDTTH